MRDRRWQFALAETGHSVPPSWSRVGAGSWSLATHPALPVIPMEDLGGVDLGVLVGWPVEPSLGLLETRWRVPLNSGEPGWAARLEAELYRLGLAFLAIVTHPDVRRLYLDPSGSVPTVFSPELRRVASTPELLVEPKARRRRSLVAALDIPSRDNWYPFGLTPWEGVDRLLPNHYLDLTSFSATRHWPGEEVPSGVDLSAAAEMVGGMLKHHIASVAARVPVQMSLTAGRDSRVLLACARAIAERIDFFTTPIPDRMGRLDVEIAGALAADHGLAHRALSYEDATEDQLAGWLDRVGHCCAGRTWRSVRTLEALDPNAAWLPGLGGEVARAYYWADDEPSGIASDPGLLVGRLGLPRSAEILDAAARWTEGLPAMSMGHTLDLLYLEQRLGCWAAPQNLGHVGVAFRAFPFNHREIFTAMLALPVQDRRSSRLSTAIIESRWPELLRLPFNEAPGLSGAAYRIARTARAGLSRLRRRW